MGNIRKVLVGLTPDLIRWLDSEGKRRDRSRGYMIGVFCGQARRRLDGDRARRAAAIAVGRRRSV